MGLVLPHQKKPYQLTPLEAEISRILETGSPADAQRLTTLYGQGVEDWGPELRRRITWRLQARGASLDAQDLTQDVLARGYEILIYQLGGIEQPFIYYPGTSFLSFLSILAGGTRIYHGLLDNAVARERTERKGNEQLAREQTEHSRQERRAKSGSGEFPQPEAPCQPCDAQRQWETLSKPSRLVILLTAFKDCKAPLTPAALAHALTCLAYPPQQTRWIVTRRLRTVLVIRKRTAEAGAKRLTQEEIAILMERSVDTIQRWKQRARTQLVKGEERSRCLDYRQCTVQIISSHLCV